MYFDEDVLLIAGPTASGKTGLSIDAAKASGAVVINTDSMQVYRDLQVVSARPGPEETGSVPHELFGYVDGAQAYSVARWLEDVAKVVSRLEVSGQKLVFVGGTGLYFNTLLYGLSPVPVIDPAIRKKWREEAENTEAAQLHLQLAERDPSFAATLDPNDTQRIIRALEVLESTGKSLSEWQAEQSKPSFGDRVTLRKVLVLPEREVTHARINRRFDQMVKDGALKEVETLVKRNLDPALPVMKAIGVPQLQAYLSGDISLGEAIERAKAATRQYAKRQSTWFRNSFDNTWEQFDG